MNIFESFRIAWVALTTNKMRALLTMLGIIIGVSAVISMLAIGNGLSKSIQSEFNRLGAGVFYVTPQITSPDADVTQSPQLTAADAAALVQPGAAPAVRAVAVEYSTSAVVSAGGERYYYPVKGITPNYFTISDNTLGAGRYYGEDDERGRARVAVIGKDVATSLFGSVAGAVGQRVTVNGINLDVVGVLTTKPSQAADFNTPAETVYIPYETARTRLFRNELSAKVDLSQITIQARSNDQVEEAIRQATQLLRERHRLTYQSNDFSVSNPEQLMAQIETTIVGLNAFLGTIAGISLLVGGVGIMNIMLVSVTQRTREIGLRKAVGARGSNILQQFLIEALVLCLIGGALGVALGYAMSFAGTFVLQQVFGAQDAQASVSLGSIILATAVSAGIGIFFGFFPALRAARLPPIQALRSE